tara:strand:- start:56 stop:292 length:237 start_codon:yes stop_codon:yes gene_type:complete
MLHAQITAVCVKMTDKESNKTREKACIKKPQKNRALIIRIIAVSVCLSSWEKITVLTTKNNAAKYTPIPSDTLNISDK